MKTIRVEQVAFNEDFILQIHPIWGGDASRNYLLKVLNHEAAVTLAYADSKGPLWAWGAVEMWAGVGDVWCCFDVRAGKYAREILHFAGKDIKIGAAMFKRLQGQIPIQAPTLKLSNRFGFEIEGLMKNYGMGAKGDYIMVARVANA
jgi:hypothetical protein